MPRKPFELRSLSTQQGNLLAHIHTVVAEWVMPQVDVDGRHIHEVLSQALQVLGLEAASIIATAPTRNQPFLTDDFKDMVDKNVPVWEPVLKGPFMRDDA